MSDKQHNTRTSNNYSERAIAGLDRQIIEASPSGMILVDAQADDIPIMYANVAFETLTGYSSDEVIGRNCRFLQGDDRDQPDLDILRDAIENKKACTVTLRNYRKDGSMFWNELHTSPVFGAAGQLTHFVGIQNDVTRREEALDQLRTTSANLRAMLDSSKQSFTLIDTNARVVDFDRRGAQIAEDVLGSLFVRVKIFMIMFLNMILRALQQISIAHWREKRSLLRRSSMDKMQPITWKSPITR